ncbi:hypothetical protein B0H14DRAFT_3461792 [Mycena olivaceomarginata]|nr:hypothetical protein B0H14DRAFT_3461792 [Mycena olivaceomarginata]
MEVEPFLNEVKTNIRLQRMTDDRDKTSYLSTYHHIGPDAIVLVRPKPAAFDDYVALAIEIDNDLHESELADREHTQNTHAKGSGSGSGSASNSRSAPHQKASTPQAPTVSTATSSSEVVPMEVDAITVRDPLTQAEKDRRRQANLCLYCGGAGHNADHCANKSDKAKKCDAVRKAASASAGKA